MLDRAAGGHAGKKSRRGTWTHRWEAAMRSAGVPEHDWYVPSVHRFRKFSEHFLRSGPHDNAAEGYVKDIGPMRAALNAVAAEQGDGTGAQRPWGVDGINAAVEAYATAVQKIISAERLMNGGAGADAPASDENDEQQAPAIPEDTLIALLNRADRAARDQDMTTVGLVAGTSFIPLLFTLRANSVGASDMAGDIVFNAAGAHLRLRKMKSWSKDGRECDSYPGGAVNLRKQVWLHAPWGVGPGHPRTRMLKHIETAQAAGTLRWLMAGGDDEREADRAYAAAAERVNKAMRVVTLPLTDGAAAAPTLRDSGPAGRRPLTSHSPRKTAVAILRAMGASYDVIRARGLWTQASTVERYYAPYEGYTCSAWAKSLFDYVEPTGLTQTFFARRSP